MPLSNEYFTKALAESKARLAVTAAGATSTTPDVTEPSVSVQDTTPTAPINAAATNLPVTSTGEEFLLPPISPEEQKARNELDAFGLPRNKLNIIEKARGLPLSPTSPSTYKNLPQEIGSVFGMNIPADEDWDRMSRSEQAIRITGQTASAALKLALGLPKAVMSALPNFIVQAAKPIQALSEGRIRDAFDLEKLSQQPNIEIPFLSSIPVLGEMAFKPENDYYGLAKKSGDEVEMISKDLGVPVPIARFMGKAWSATSVGLNAFGDISITGAMAEAMVKALQPRGVIIPGEGVKRVEPIKFTMAEENGRQVYRQPEAQAASDYYSLPKSYTNEKWGGTTANTYWKTAPSAGGSVELSVVRIVDPKAGPYIKINGIPVPVVQGKFGKEIKLHTEMLSLSGEEAKIAAPKFKETPIAPDVAEAAYHVISEMDTAKAGSRYLIPITEEGQGSGFTAHAERSSFPEWVPSGPLRSKSLFDSATTKLSQEYSGETVKFTKNENRIVELMREEIARRTNQSPQNITNNMLVSDVEKTRIKSETEGKLQPITPPLKGMENKLVSQKDIENIDNITRVIGLSPEIRDAVLRNVTGKTTAADLTQMEYFKAAEALSSFKTKFIPETEVPFLSRYLQPQRHWTAPFEEKTGIPIHTTWQRLEEAEMLSKVKVADAKAEIRQIAGDYLNDPEFGRIVRAYRLGDVAAINENPNLTLAQKTDLIDIASKMTEYYKTRGPDMNVPIEIFLQGPYSPVLADLGGKFAQYKEQGKIPAPSDIQLEGGESIQGSSFFSKQKREGTLNTILDNEFELGSIYAEAGYKSKFFDPVLRDAKVLAENLPPEILDSLSSMVQEKLGYGGTIEKWMDTNVPKMISKLPFASNVTIPPDFARQMMNYSMSYVSANIMTQPASMFRDLLSYPTMGYANIGSKFMTETMANFAKDPKAMFENAKKRGFILDMGATSDVDFRQNVMGGQAGKTFRQVTEKAVSPKAYADNVTRVLIVDQSQRIFEDALGRYNTGKITYEQFEKETQLGGFSLPDRNVIRQRLIEGNVEGATNRYIQEFIDDSVWPYRKGSSARVTYGAAGKLGSFLLKWPLEYGTTLNKWVQRGQWDKIIRLYASASALNRTIKESFGWDFSTSFLLGPLMGVGLSPLPKMAWNAISGFGDMLQGNIDGIDQNRDEFMKTFKASGRPGGVLRLNWERFNRSYDEGPIGPDGTYPVRNDSGKLIYYAPFKDIFWQLWGFPSTEKTQHQNLASKESTLINVNNKMKADAKKAMLQLLRERRMDEANQLAQSLAENGVFLNISDQDRKNQYIPLDQQLFKSASPQLKQFFAPDIIKLYNK